jgi:hypothetical protein
MFCGQIRRQLEAVHPATAILFRHLLVENAASRCHCTSPGVAQAVTVLDRAGQDVGDGFDAAMWMTGKSGRVIVPQCAHTPGSLPREIDTSDTHFCDLTCPQGCLRVPFSPLQPKTFSDASRWKSMRLSVILNVHAGRSKKERVESHSLRHIFKKPS